MIRTYTHLYIWIVLAVSSLISACNVENKEAQESADENKYLRDELTVQRGTELFNLHCASCHNFIEDVIGPNLAGITSEVDKQWLIDFIKNPVKVIESGDERAVGLYNKYNQYMPPFPMLDDEEIEYILGFIHKFSEAEKRNKSNRKGGLLDPIPEKIATSGLTLEIEEVFKVPGVSNLTPFTRINQMEPGPDDRLFIHDLRGTLYVVNDDYSLSTYIDLSKEVKNFIDHPGKGSGFGSWTFHPNFPKNGLFYTTHTEPPGSSIADYPLPDSIKVTLQSVLMEWKTDSPSAKSFSGTSRELLRVDMATGAHTFQHITFNPLTAEGDRDYGMLYLGIGDAVLSLIGYPELCDNIRHIWGSVIRIDPMGNNGPNGQYGIPDDNPFVDNPNALGEIWAYGFRNPHRIVWDKNGSGIMLITNIGQHSIEEVNLGVAGANYGWPYREGTFEFDLDANIEVVYPVQEESNYMPPVIQYDHDEGTAVSGGFVYAGSSIADLEGKYLFGDMTRGTLFYTDVSEISQGALVDAYRLNLAFEGRPNDLETITQNKRVDLRIGEDADGELYLFSKSNGTVYKVVGSQKKEL